MGARHNFLSEAKINKKNEFYTQLPDIQREINAYIEFNPNVFRDKTILLPCDDPEWSNFTKFFAQNFTNFGLKKLISTSYALNSRDPKIKSSYQYSLFETESPQYNPKITDERGKIFTLTRKNKNVDINDLKWNYLDGDGDFRSDEIKQLRDESDIIITNPPFSLFREFIQWIIEANKKFVVIGHQNSILSKEIFPLIKNNKIWLGRGFKGGYAHFINKYYDDYATAGDHKDGMIRVSGVVWFTNLEHRKRHHPLQLMTLADNIKYSKHKEIKGVGYQKYDNYDAIEIPFTNAIPSDYKGVMGVPVTFLNKYCPEQFEILGCTQRGCHDEFLDTKKYDDYKEYTANHIPTGSSGGKTNENANLERNDGINNYFKNKEGHIVQSAFGRIFIRNKFNKG